MPAPLDVCLPSPSPKWPPPYEDHRRRLGIQCRADAISVPCRARAGRGSPAANARKPSAARNFCSGCPHNTSTHCCPKARAPSPLSGATTWPFHADGNGHDQIRWAAKAIAWAASTGARMKTMSVRQFSATAPIPIRAASHRARRHVRAKWTYKTSTIDAVAMTGGSMSNPGRHRPRSRSRSKPKGVQDHRHRD